jgi:hypothetical protein
MIKNNYIAYNESNLGGGIYSNATARIINNIIAENLALNRGGGLFTIHYSGPITNNTITKNRAINQGGGLLSHDSTMAVTNNIFWDNEAQVRDEIFYEAGGIPSITYCDVKGGWSGTGNIDAYPCFIDPDSMDFHLRYDSPCRDLGDNAAPGLQDEDFEGDPRPAQGTVDMGADEFYTHLYYTGDPTPGGGVKFRFVGIPGTSPVQLWLGSGVMDPPLHTQYGEWFLSFPLLAHLTLGAIPSPEGVLTFPFTFPPETPTPLSLPLQAGVGAVLTNLCEMNVQ